MAIQIKSYTLVLNDGSAPVSGELRVSVDDSITIGSFSAATFLSSFGLQLSTLVIESGYESDLDDFGLGMITPGALSLTFTVDQAAEPSVGFRYFRQAVTGIALYVNSELKISGVIDKNELSYESQDRILSVTTLPFIGSRRQVRSPNGGVDGDLLAIILGESQEDYINDPWDGINPYCWVRIKYAFKKILEYMGATSVEFGDFNRFLSTVRTGNADTVTIGNTYSGWNNSGTFESWAATAGPNYIFDRLLVNKSMLFGWQDKDGRYPKTSVSTVKDMLDMLTKAFFAVVQISPDGKGYVFPLWGDIPEQEIPDSAVESIAIEGYLPAMLGVAVQSWFDGVATTAADENDAYPHAYYTVINQMYFETVYDSEVSAVIGTVRYNEDDLLTIRSNVSLFRFTNILPEGCIHQQGLDSLSDDDTVLVLNLPVSTLPAEYGYFNLSPTISGTVVSGWGFSKTVVSESTHDGWTSTPSTSNLHVVFDILGDSGVMKSYVQKLMELLYDFRKVEREIYTLQLIGTDYVFSKYYTFPDSGQHDSSVLLRPVRISTDYINGKTEMECVNVKK